MALLRRFYMTTTSGSKVEIVFPIITVFDIKEIEKVMKEIGEVSNG
jgi:hypothetical protein